MSILNAAIDYSIIIATYNPDERLLTRCLKAVLALDRAHFNTEVILIDNNSKQAVRDLPYVQELAAQIPNLQHLFVKEQGSSHARLAAYHVCKGKYMINLDYDNEPTPAYLTELDKLRQQYPMVVAWGPGDVTVDFIDGEDKMDKGLRGWFLGVFQERHEQQVAYAHVYGWQNCYPFGTGMCVEMNALRNYMKLADAGQLRVSGRQGKMLFTGEDIQLVWVCIMNGGAAGVAPGLQVKHMIPGDRLTLDYLMRLLFGSYGSADTCLLQLFPEQRPQYEAKLLPADKFGRQAFKRIVKARLSRNPDSMPRLAQWLGEKAGTYFALGKPLPPRVEKLLKWVKLY